MNGTVYLVGAGPGDPDLLTLKAARLLKQADVVLFDHLVSDDVLSLASPGCELVNVGKRDGRHTIPQERINELLCSYARRAQTVVRLKGGDPFVFGRGGEEAAYLSARGIAVEVVPGVTSAVAAPAMAGVPVTHRGVASSCAFVTGHECTGKDRTVNWTALAGVDTLVILMGVRERARIARRLLDAGRSPLEPVVFVERATLPEQRTVETTLDRLAEDPPDVHAPAVMVVGEVVRLRHATGIEAAMAQLAGVPPAAVPEALS